MNSMYTYLLVNLFSLSVPLWWSFDSRIQLHKNWPALFLSIAIAAGVFITWDAVFTSWGVWGFNGKYLLGYYIFGLPIEEWMFFFCIPYACIFSYEALRYFFPKDYFAKSSTYITLVLSVVLLVIGCLHLDKAYTASTFIAFPLFLLSLQFIFKVDYLGRFYQTYLFILIPFLIVNGILTGTGLDEEVVWYNPAENLGIRILTIPIEDTFYGMFLILLILSIFEKFKKKIIIEAK
ncbi:lycopene cyclase domain-containing protein [uncultured Cytophaga sp.]|uniref:lycopene cyclase domain-containing protein n=1 Tax=uncultured Cytophaga sp. TaxID=160238 RepID=UPI00260867AB|nr:lycopene cyclase domain-containing protein [uncultured Cytophaga sp.]